MRWALRPQEPDGQRLGWREYGPGEDIPDHLVTEDRARARRELRQELYRARCAPGVITRTVNRVVPERAHEVPAKSEAQLRADNAAKRARRSEVAVRSWESTPARRAEADDDGTADVA